MTEKRTRLLLIVLVLGQLLLLSAQVPAADGGQTLLASAWLGGVGPLAATVDAAASGLGALGVYWTTRRRLLSDNAVLRRENATLRREAIKSLASNATSTSSPERSPTRERARPGCSWPTSSTPTRRPGCAPCC